MPAPVVAARGIRKEFPGVLALDDVAIELRAGEVHALAGENGSGKSTLAKILFGALPADAGIVEVDGERVQLGSPRQALERGIVAISQELTLAPTLTVAENVLMGRLPRRSGGVIDWKRARRLAREALQQLGVDLDPSVRVGDLAIELQQEVEIARAVSARSRVLILDEATSSLSEPATKRLLEQLEQLRRSGAAILFVSHRLRELYACSERATVLRDGRLVGTVPLSTTPERELVRMMVGREIADLFGKRPTAAGEPVLRVESLDIPDVAVRDVSLQVGAGEIVGIAGLTGCGKEELALALTGAIASHGRVVVDGCPVRLRNPGAALAAGIALVPGDRKRNGILPTRTVRHNLSLGWKHHLSALGVINTRREGRIAADVARRFAVRAASLDVPITELSGGNQQKVVLSRSFSRRPRVLVLAEPTRGIDVGAKREIYSLIQDEAARGTAVLIVSSELPELLGLADRILVMFRGRIRGEFLSTGTTEDEITHVALGGAGRTP